MFRVKDWSSFQSYKDRRPPWIRFHKTILDNRQFQIMSAEARALLPMLWLIASEDEDPRSGLIRGNFDDISYRLRLDVKVIKKAISEITQSGFLIEESISYGIVTGSLPRDREETETKAETETEYTLHLDAAFEVYNQFARENGLTVAQSFTGKRKTSLGKRLSECGGLDGWIDALNKAKISPFLMGQNDRGWRMDLDFLLQQASFTKLMEGSYTGNAKPQVKKDPTADRMRMAMDVVRELNK